MTIDNGSVKVGIDREKGGAITWLSSDAYPQNAVNIADPGREISSRNHCVGMFLRSRIGGVRAHSQAGS